MSLKFQVYANFTLKRGKPSLVGTSLHSTKSAVTTIPISHYNKTYRTISRIFHTLQEAHNYIVYLYGVYKISPITFPVLDNEQLKLFEEV